MTHLADAEIADAARVAGFAEAALPPAIACALAASGGWASYEHVIHPGPLARYVGLWGVDTVEHPSLSGLALTNPYAAARAARGLTEGYGSFDWCPAYRSGLWAPYLTRARAAANRLPLRELQHVPILVEAHRDAHAARRLSAGRTYNALTDGRRRRH